MPPFENRLGTTGRLDLTNFGCLEAFGATGGLEFDFGAIIQGAETLSLNLRMMNKQILAAAIGGNESKTFFRVKPLHCTYTHVVKPSFCIVLRIQKRPGRKHGFGGKR